MSDAPRHLSPGGHTLGFLELCQVVENQDHAHVLILLVLEQGQMKM